MKAKHIGLLLLLFVVALSVYVQLNPTLRERKEDKSKDSLYQSIKATADSLILIKNTKQDSIKKKRVLIFYDIATKQDKMLEVSKSIFTPYEFEKAAEYENLKYVEIKDNIIKKYNITSSEYNKIIYEGAKNNWPMPNLN